MEKTLEQLYEELSRSDELKKQLAEILKNKDRAALQDWLKQQGCDVDTEEVKEFLQEKYEELQESGELTPEELEAAAGGTVVPGWVTMIIIFGGGAAALGGSLALGKCLGDETVGSGC